jgi:hypothetical protein
LQLGILDCEGGSLRVKGGLLEGLGECHGVGWGLGLSEVEIECVCLCVRACVLV